MPYDISIPDNRDYILVKWHGNASPSELKQSGVEAIELAAERNVSKVLIDACDIRNRLSATDLFLATVEHSRLGPPRPHAALVGRPDQERELIYIETAGINRRLPFKAFTDMDDALAWLNRIGAGQG